MQDATKPRSATTTIEIPLPAGPTVRVARGFDPTTLDRRADVDPRVASLVTLRYLGGRTLREAAEDRSVAPRTADAWWAYARAWFTADLSRG